MCPVHKCDQYRGWRSRKSSYVENDISPKLRAKSIKFRDLPTLGHMHAEHALIQKRLPKVVDYSGDLDLRIQFALGNDEKPLLVHLTKLAQTPVRKAANPHVLPRVSGSQPSTPRTPAKSDGYSLLTQAQKGYHTPAAKSAPFGEVAKTLTSASCVDDGLATWLAISTPKNALTREKEKERDARRDDRQLDYRISPLGGFACKNQGIARSLMTTQLPRILRSPLKKSQE